jgi:hypothetical protein
MSVARRILLQPPGEHETDEIIASVDAGRTHALRLITNEDASDE